MRELIRKVVTRHPGMGASGIATSCFLRDDSRTIKQYRTCVYNMSAEGRLEIMEGSNPNAFFIADHSPEDLPEPTYTPPTPAEIEAAMAIIKRAITHLEILTGAMEVIAKATQGAS